MTKHLRLLATLAVVGLAATSACERVVDLRDVPIDAPPYIPPFFIDAGVIDAESPPPDGYPGMLDARGQIDSSLVLPDAPIFLPDAPSAPLDAPFGAPGDGVTGVRTRT